MEHIVQFAIGIDDEAVRKRIEESAYNDILNDFKEEFYNSLPMETHGYYSKKTDQIDYTRLIHPVLQEFVDNNADAIIDKAAEKLCDSFRRTKAFKERMSDACFRSDKEETNE